MHTYILFRWRRWRRCTIEVRWIPIAFENSSKWKAGRRRKETGRGEGETAVARRVLWTTVRICRYVTGRICVCVYVYSICMYMCLCMCTSMFMRMCMCMRMHMYVCWCIICVLMPNALRIVMPIALRGPTLYVVAYSRSQRRLKIDFWRIGLYSISTANTALPALKLLQQTQTSFSTA